MCTIAEINETALTNIDNIEIAIIIGIDNIEIAIIIGNEIDLNAFYINSMR